MSDALKTFVQMVAGEYDKVAADLTAGARAHIAPKNFALSKGQSSTGKPAYPIHDEAHARSALSYVKQHGSPDQINEVYKDVAAKYPHLAAKSSVPGLREMHEKGGSLMAQVGQKILGPRGMAAGQGLASRVGTHLAQHGEKYDLAGLGLLAAPAAAGLAQGKDKAHNAAELGGLGLIAAPVAAGLMRGHP